MREYMMQRLNLLISQLTIQVVRTTHSGHALSKIGANLLSIHRQVQLVIDALEGMNADQANPFGHIRAMVMSDRSSINPLPSEEK